MATMEEQNDIAIQARDFRNKVDSMLETEEERGRLLDALRNYHETKKIKRLVRDLKMVLDTIKKYPLFKEIRALIPPEHLFAYDKLTEGARTGERIAHLKRHGNEPLGFKFKGGKEHDIGVYVTSITPGSAAHASGLRIGDEILKVNGLVLHESTHDEVINLIKNKRSVTFVTRNMGKIPNKENNQIVWQEIDPNMRIGPPDLWDSKFINLATGQAQAPDEARQDDRMLAFKIGKEGLGCSIGSGIAGHKGIYVSAVSASSLADQVGLKVGDQILNVNGRGFENVKHSEAVESLKARRDLTMIVRYNEEVAEHFRRKNKLKNKVLLPILLKEGEERERRKKATFGENVVVEIIENPVSSNEEEIVEDEDEDDINEEPGISNFEYDKEITQGKEVHFVSILKTAPLMIDLEMKNERIVVRNVIKGGAASDNGFLKRGDVLLNVEGVDLVGLSLIEAQEALSDAMGRLANYIDIMVACPPGRKPPAKPDRSAQAQAEEALYQFARRRPSAGLSDDDTAQVSAVAKAIAQFESHFPKKNQFLVRRDSLEKARNSLRLYKEKKRSSLWPNQLDGSPKLSHSTASTNSPARTTYGNFTTESARINAGGSDLSPSLNRKSAFSMPDPEPVIPHIRTQRQIRSFDSSGSSEKIEDEMLVLSQNEPSASHQGISSHFKPLSGEIRDLKPLSGEIRDLSSESLSQASDENRFSTNVDINRSVNHNMVDNASRQTQDNKRPQDLTAGKLEFSTNRHEVRAQVHSPPLMSSDDMIVSWSPTSPLHGFSSQADKKSVTFKENDALIKNREFMLSPTGRSRSMDDLADESEQMTENHRQRSGRKKSVGFKDTVENIHPPDVTLYKSLDDISMIGKNGWGKSKSRQIEHPGSKLSPKKSALRNSPSPVHRTNIDGYQSGQSNMLPESQPDYGITAGKSAQAQGDFKSNEQPANVLKIKKRFEDDSALPSHLRISENRFRTQDSVDSTGVSGYGPNVKEPTPDNQQYKTYHGIFAQKVPNEADDVGRSHLPSVTSEKASTVIQNPKVHSGFFVSSDASHFNDATRPMEGLSQAAGPKAITESSGPSVNTGPIDSNVQTGMPDSYNDEIREKALKTAAGFGKQEQLVAIASIVKNVPNETRGNKLPTSSETSGSSHAKDQTKSRQSKQEAIEIPEPDYETDEISGAGDSQPQNGESPAPEISSVVAQPDAKVKRKDNSLGLTTRLLSNAKDKLKRVGFKRSSVSGSSDGAKTQAKNASPKVAKTPAIPPPPPPPPPPPLIPPTPHSFNPATSTQQKPKQSLLEQLQTSPVRKSRPEDGSKQIDSANMERSESSYVKTSALLSESMHAGIASEETENVKIAAVVAGEDSAPRKHSERPGVKAVKHPPMNELLNELKGKVKSHEARKRSEVDEKALNDAEGQHFKNDQGVVSTERSVPKVTPQQSSKSSSDVRETRISRRQAQGVEEIDSSELSLNSTSVTPRAARVEKEKALLEMEGTLKAFDDVIRSLDTEL